MNSEAKHIDEGLRRDLLRCRDIFNSAVGQLIAPPVYPNYLLESEQDNDATPRGAD